MVILVSSSDRSGIPFFSHVTIPWLGLHSTVAVDPRVTLSWSCGMDMNNSSVVSKGGMQY